MSVYTNRSSASPEQAQAYVAALLELLGDQDPLAVLRETPGSVQRILGGVSAAAITTPESAGKWSMRDVVQHLADSELVGGFRLRLILAQDRPPLTPFDQDLWAERLRYREVPVQDAFEQFSVLRRVNLRLWENVAPADLARVGLHGERGEESVAHLRRLYAAHDLLHLRQLERIKGAVS